MPRTAVLITLSSLFFFGVFLPEQRFTHAKRSIPVLWGMPQVTSPAAALWRALVTGDDQGLSLRDKRVYYRLGLGHLFTPSGVHLSSLGPLLKIPGLCLLIALLATTNPALLALARVAWLRLSRNRSWPAATYVLVLLGEGLLISWPRSAVSWTCSWLFLGLTLFAPKRQRVLWFFLGQLLLSWVLLQPLSLLSPLANGLASVFLLPLFPVVLVLSFIPLSSAHEWTLEALAFFHHGVLGFDSVHHWLLPLRPHAGHVVLLLLWLCVRERRALILGVSLLLLAAPLDGYYKPSSHTSRWEVVPFKSASHKGNGRFSDGVRCKWREGLRCRPPRRGATK